jgi:hypothetical protein
MLGRRAHGELVHVGLAERDEGCRAQLAHNGRVIWGDPALEDTAASGRRHVDRAEHVFDGDGNASELAENLAVEAACVDGCRGRKRRVGEVQEGVDVAVDRGDAVEVCRGDLDTRDLFRREQPAEGFGAQAGETEVAHCSSPRMAETLKRDPSCSGAPESACSTVRVSPGTSGR